jgi:ribonuclease P protein component
VGVPTTGRIRSRQTFQSLRRPSGRGRSGAVRVAFVGPGLHATFPQVAYAIGHQNGSAVHRNRIRRRLRAAVTELARTLEPGSYLVGADSTAENLPFGQLVADLGVAMSTACRRAAAS